MSISLRITSQIVLALLIGLSALVTYRLFLHPLARIPGPRLAAISNIWHAWHMKHGRMTVLGKTLHQKYGPMVRVGPNEVWFNTKDAFDAIYSTSRGFEKSDFYLATALTKPDLNWKLEAHFQDTLDLLSERDMKRYRLQRRLIGRVYQPANLAKLEPSIDEALERAVLALHSLNGEEVDLKEWMHMIAVECLGACVLSWSPGLLKSQTDFGTSVHSYQSWRRKSVFGLFPTVTKLQHEFTSLNRLFGILWGVVFIPPKGFRPFFPDVGKRVSKRINGVRRANPDHIDHKDLMADLIQLHQDRPEFNEQYLRKMAVTNFGAGHETMASTLTSAFAAIATRSHVQERMATEIRTTPDPTAYANTSRLTYTRAAVREAMRLYPVISVSIPRRVPSSGLHLHSRFFPSGTTVGCNPVSLHRNKDIFGADTHLFDPNRWLDGDAEEVKTMEKYSLNWGGGSRACPGKNLAELMVWKIIPAILENFDVEITSMPSEEEMPAYFLSMMTGVRARFTPAVGGQ